jgi:cytochrome c5
MVIRQTTAALFVLLLLAGSGIGPSASAAGASPPAQAAAQTADPLARGREGVGQACIQCHNLRFLTLEPRSAERWRKTVYEMIGRGAQVKPDEIEPIISYLAASFNPSSPAAQTAGGQPPAGAGALPEGAGRAVLQSRCGQCHAVTTVTTARHTKQEWTDTLQKMRVLGVTLGADEQNTLIAYLSEHFAPGAR